MNNKITLLPSGKRTKSIIIQGIFQEETNEEKDERDEIIFKTFLSFGFVDNKTS